jgi:undecaprenyl-diphosphatase
VFELYLAAIIEAVVEGLTEFLPVSSTGHMILVSDVMNFNFKGHESFEIFIQLGAILAIVFLYPKRFSGLIPRTKDFFADQTGFAGWRGVALLGIGCVPAFVLGALFHGAIKSMLFHPLPVAAALVVGGIVLVWVERRPLPVRVQTIDQLTFKDALLIGIAQCCALWPGISRSASTIVGALLLGVGRQTAAEFSFLLAVPVMCAAVTFDLISSADQLSLDLLPLFAIGFIVAFAVALIAVKCFVALLNRLGLQPFGYYRIVLGGAVLVAYYTLHG